VREQSGAQNDIANRGGSSHSREKKDFIFKMDIAEECAFVYYNSTSENGTFVCEESYLHVSEGF